jgi:hypothetical protein
MLLLHGDTPAAVGPEKGRLIPTGDADLKRPLSGVARWILVRLLCGRVEPACDAGSPLVELPVDFAFT